MAIIGRSGGKPGKQKIDKWAQTAEAEEKTGKIEYAATEVILEDIQEEVGEQIAETKGCVKTEEYLNAPVNAQNQPENAFDEPETDNLPSETKSHVKVKIDANTQNSEEVRPFTASVLEQAKKVKTRGAAKSIYLNERELDFLRKMEIRDGIQASSLIRLVLDQFIDQCERDGNI